MSTALWGSLLPRLVARGMLDGDAALTGRVTVEPRTRSHHVAVIRQDARAVCVAKHHRDSPDPGDPGDTEEALYRWLAQQPACTTATARPGSDAPLAPTLLGVMGDTLLLEARDHDLPLHLALRATAWQPDALLAALGRLLGRLHASDPPSHDLGVTSQGPPWVLAVADGALPASLSGDERIARLAAEVAGDPDLAGCLHALAARWPGNGRGETNGSLPRQGGGGRRDGDDDATTGSAVLVHGDVKFDNVLVEGVHGPTDPAATPRLRLLDWELAGPGLAAWDLAGIVDGLLVPALQVLPTAQALAEGDHAAPALHAHLAVPGAPPVSGELLRIATVARLVQSAFQLLAMRHQEPGREAAVAPVLAGARALAGQHVAAGI